jgi:hypothetical protein
MTSLKQFEANRSNALKSTGPRTDAGKSRCRRNALRHGLAAQTVIEILEDVEDYRAFEANIIADYDVRTAVERELVLRLASLLWRLRRATSIETDLLRIQATIVRDRQDTCELATDPEPTAPNEVYSVVERAVAPGDTKGVLNGGDDFANDSHSQSDESFDAPVDSMRRLTYSFMRLANIDNAIFDRLNRYESKLWRQFVQTWFALQPLRHRESRLV